MALQTFTSVAAGVWSSYLVWNTARAITAVNTGTKTFTVAGDRTSEFNASSGNPSFGYLQVQGSTGNNGTYTVVSSSFGGGNTNIVVSEAVPSAVADGTLTARTYPTVNSTAASTTVTVNHEIVCDFGDIEITTGSITVSTGGHLIGHNTDQFASLPKLILQRNAVLEDLLVSCVVDISQTSPNNADILLINTHITGAVTWVQLSYVGTLTLDSSSVIDDISLASEQGNMNLVGGTYGIVADASTTFGLNLTNVTITGSFTNAYLASSTIPIDACDITDLVSTVSASIFLFTDNTKIRGNSSIADITSFNGDASIYGTFNATTGLIIFGGSLDGPMRIFGTVTLYAGSILMDDIEVYGTLDLNQGPDTSSYATIQLRSAGAQVINFVGTTSVSYAGASGAMTFHIGL